jgi:poly(A) polymerase
MTEKNSPSPEGSSQYLPQPLPWHDRDDLLSLCHLLDGDAGHGSGARLVGGVVRDALLGVSASDIDIATPLTPETVSKLAQSAGLKVIPTGIDHGTVTIILAKGSVEVTTLRRDVSTDGRRATVAFSSDWKEDAARRDFTFNALYAQAESGRLYDYFDGEDDLKSGAVRFIGNAKDRICEDYLRIMRYFRFHAFYGRGPVDTDTLSICTQLAPRLTGLSRERIAHEFLRLLMAPSPADTLRAMSQANIWEYIAPEISSKGINRLENIISNAQKADISLSAIARLAALLSQERTVADKMAAKLRLSRKQQKMLVKLVTGKQESADGIISQAYYNGAQTALELAALNAPLSQLLLAKTALENWEKPVFPISGRDVIAAGVTPGPLVSQILQSAEKSWLEHGCPPINNSAEYIKPVIEKVSDSQKMQKF